MKLKQSTLYRTALFLLTTTLVLCAWVIVHQQRSLDILRADYQNAADLRFWTIQYHDELQRTQDQLTRQREINAHMERWLNEAARENKSQDPFKPVVETTTAATAGDCLTPSPVVKK